jgi:predicted TIM-barrel enzyme
MTAKFKTVFGEGKPVIAMVHLGALPGSPLHDHEAGVEAIVENARKDLKALQAAGFDAVMFGNENDRPYEFEVDTASTATMGYVIGRLRSEITVPFGVNVLWDPESSIALAAATGARFVREIFTGTYASDSLPDRARSAVFSSIPDAILVSGAITGEAAKMVDLEAVKAVLPTTPVLANTGVKHSTVADVLEVADCCIVGSSLKVDGDTWKAVDPDRAAEFMRLVRQARGY